MDIASKQGWGPGVAEAALRGAISPRCSPPGFQGPALSTVTWPTCCMVVALLLLCTPPLSSADHWVGHSAHRRQPLPGPPQGTHVHALAGSMLHQAQGRPESAYMYPEGALGLHAQVPDGAAQRSWEGMQRREALLHEHSLEESLQGVAAVQDDRARQPRPRRALPGSPEHERDLDPCAYGTSELTRLKNITTGQKLGLGAQYTGNKLHRKRYSELKSMEDFEFFRHVARYCATGNLDEAMLHMPLNLPRGVKAKDFCITQENVPDYVWCDSHYKNYWDKIQPALEPEKRLVYGSKSVFKSCALVGSSGNLLRRHYGEDIQKHQGVWRFNLAPAGGTFTKHVGIKTTFRMLNNKNVRIQALDGHMRPHSKHTEQVFWEKGATLIMSRMPPANVSHYVHVMRDTMSTKPDGKEVTVALSDKRFLYFSNYAFRAFRHCKALSDGREYDHASKTTSTGLMTVLAALHLCKHVTTFGMGEPAMRNGIFHYYPDNYSLRHGELDANAHDFDTEREMLAALANAGILRQCTINGCVGKAYPWAEDPQEEYATGDEDGGEDTLPREAAGIPSVSAAILKPTADLR